MTPPDQSDEQPSALSRLERALAGFGEPARTEEPEAEVKQELEDEPELEDAREPEEASEPFAQDEDEDEDEADESEQPDSVESSPILDIASAVDAVERLSAAPEPERVSTYIRERPRSDADEFVFAAAGGDDDERDVDLSLGVDEGSDLAEAPEPPPFSRISDSADAWQRNTGDQRLPYFLVEDDLPLAAEPTPAIEELRQASAEKKPSGSVVRTLAEIPILLIVAALIAFLVKTFLAQAYYIPSGSMLPQLQIDDRVVVSKLAYKAHDPRRGDIVVFDDPRAGATTAEPDEGIFRKIGEGIGIVQPSTDEFIKRVIGLPGDTVEGRDGHVYVNGHLLIEPYLKDDVVTSDFQKTTVGNGKLWVMGDNRSGSADSRVFGQIKIDTIVGRAMVTVWPFDHIQFL